MGKKNFMIISSTTDIPHIRVRVCVCILSVSNCYLWSDDYCDIFPLYLQLIDFHAGSIAITSIYKLKEYSHISTTYTTNIIKKIY